VETTREPTYWGFRMRGDPAAGSPLV
jgi:hypothetical protein